MFSVASCLLDLITWRVEQQKQNLIGSCTAGTSASPFVLFETLRDTCRDQRLPDTLEEDYIVHRKPTRFHRKPTRFDMTFLFCTRYDGVYSVQNQNYGDTTTFSGIVEPL